MILYVMRHGTTEWNIQQKMQGQADIPLNEKGKEDAIKASFKLKDIHFNKCYCSPLIRAKETANLVLSDKTCEIIPEDLLKEITFGINEGKTMDMINNDPENALHTYFRSPENYIPAKGGESVYDLLKRGNKFLTKISKEEHNSQKILIVSHGAFIKGLITIVNHQSAADFWHHKEQKNCAVTVFEFKDGKWKLLQDAVDILAGEKLCD